MKLFVAEERSQEKLFKDWLTQCHRSLDKVTRFEKIGGKEVQVRYPGIQTTHCQSACFQAFLRSLSPYSYIMQAEAEQQVGKLSCVFERISDGSRTVERGDLVQLAVKPHLVGRVCFFSVSQVFHGLRP